MQPAEQSRYEIKLVTNDLMLPQLRAWLRVHAVGFGEAHPCRQVNNIYFDTPHLASVLENLSGISTKRKVRFRWYGDNSAAIRGILEVKCKRNMHGWKLSQPLSRRLDLSRMTWAEIMQAIHGELRDDLCIHLDRARIPVLINRYLREYYISSDGMVRATLDYSQRVYAQRGRAVPNLDFALPPSSDLVLEFKSNPKDHQRLADAIAGFPLRVGKHSKYVGGVQALLGH